MDKKIRIGVIGCGGIANGKHMPAEKRNPASEMVAFCDIIEEQAPSKRARTTALPAAPYTPTIKNCSKTRASTPCSSARPTARTARSPWRRSTPASTSLCEKPMAMNYAEAKKMLEARDKAGKVLTIGYQNRFRPRFPLSEEARQRRHLRRRVLCRSDRRPPPRAVPHLGRVHRPGKAGGRARSSTSAPMPSTSPCS